MQLFFFFFLSLCASTTFQEHNIFDTVSTLLITTDLTSGEMVHKETQWALGSCRKWNCKHTWESRSPCARATVWFFAACALGVRSWSVLMDVCEEDTHVGIETPVLFPGIGASVEFSENKHDSNDICH